MCYLKVRQPYRTTARPRAMLRVSPIRESKFMCRTQKNMQSNHTISDFFTRHLAATALSLLAISASPAADYQSTVLSDGPLAYYRLNDDTSRPTINKNSGSLGAAGNATND